MRLLFIVDSIDGSHLSEPGTWLNDLTARWVARGYRVDVLCRHTAPDEMPDDPEGVRVLRPTEEDFESALGEALDPPPDVVHIASRGPFGPRVVEIMQELPVLLDIHDYWPICPNDDLLRRPRLHPCAEHFPFQGCGECAGLTRLRAMDERTELVRHARLVVAHSAYNRTRLNAGLGRSVELLDYGVDTSRFSPEPEPPLSPDIALLLTTPDRPRVLFLGPPTHVRGVGAIIDLLVALRSRVPDVEIVVAGRDPQNPDGSSVLWVEAKELGIGDGLRTLPRVHSHDLPALYASYLVAIAPLVGPEPGGLFVLQAMAAGLPVVASPSGAHSDLIRHGEEGLLLPVDDLGSFVGGTANLLLDKVGRPVFGQAARLRAMEQHDSERALAALEVLYERIRSGSQSSAAA